MLSLDVSCKLAYVVVLHKGFLNEAELFFLCDRVNDGLQRPCASVVTGDINELLTLDLPQKLDSLVGLEILDEFGYEIVAVVVCHEVCEMIFDLLYDFADHNLIGLRHVVLKKLRTNFFCCEIDNVALQNPQFFVGITVGQFNVVLNFMHELIIWFLAVSAAMWTWRFITMTKPLPWDLSLALVLVTLRPSCLSFLLLPWLNVLWALLLAFVGTTGCFGDFV